MQFTKKTENKNYKHYIAIDWSINCLEIVRLGYQSSKAERVNMKTDIRKLKLYLKKLRGSKILTIEETTGSHWLYVELYDYVDKIIVCDPYHNSLLREGPKNDKSDAKKLCLLLRSGMLKEVYHRLDDSYKTRKLVGSYIQLINALIRVKNQKSALFRLIGLRYKKDDIKKEDLIMSYINHQYEKTILHYETQREEYLEMFYKLRKKHKQVQYLSDIPGIGLISAVKIYSQVIDGDRFSTKYKYWSYCGLVTYTQESGGKKYGRKAPRYSRLLKSVYRTSAMTSISGKNDIREYFDYLISKGYTSEESANQVARYIAKVSYAVMKYTKPYRAYQWQERSKTMETRIKNQRIKNQRIKNQRIKKEKTDNK